MNQWASETIRHKTFKELDRLPYRRSESVSRSQTYNKSASKRAALLPFITYGSRLIIEDRTAKNLFAGRFFLGGTINIDSYLLVEISWELNLSFKDLLVDSHGIVIVERVDASEHLVRQDSEGPPVDGLTVTFVQQHFGSEVLGRTAQSISARLAVLSEAEIGQLEVAFLVDKDIFWLKITVDDVERVEILEHQSDLGRIEPNRQIEMVNIFYV